jgi:CRP-like cAMP-binding protein
VSIPGLHRQPSAAAGADALAGVVEALQRVPLLAGQSAAQLAAIAQLARRQRFKRDDVIYVEGDPADALYVIVSGQVRVRVTSPEGRQVVVLLLQAGESFGESALLDGAPRTATIEAAEPTEVIVVSREDFLRLSTQSPQIVMGLLRVMARRLRETETLAAEMAFLGVAPRLAKKLLALAEAHGRRTPAGITLDLRLTQQDLAAMIGATRESVNKQLTLFREQGLLAIDRQQITVLQPKKLRDAVQWLD